MESGGYRYPDRTARERAREADLLARRFVGARRSSVFPSPIRAALGATSWSEASEITYAQDGRRISQQTFGILPKIRAVDECIRSEGLRERLFEIHPEVCFAAWQGRPMMYAKRDLRGHEERRALIAAFFGGAAFESVEAQLRGQKVALDDIADAFAALWSANRIDQGRSQPIPRGGDVRCIRPTDAHLVLACKALGSIMRFPK